MFFFFVSFIVNECSYHIFVSFSWDFVFYDGRGHPTNKHAHNFHEFLWPSLNVHLNIAKAAATAPAPPVEGISHDVVFNYGFNVAFNFIIIVIFFYSLFFVIQEGNEVNNTPDLIDMR